MRKKDKGVESPMTSSTVPPKTPVSYAAYDPPEDDAITVEIPVPIWQKMMTYVRLCDTEVAGLGYVRVLDNNRIVVEDVFILKQTVSAGNATFDDVAYHEFIMNLVNENERRAAAGKPEVLARIQWHSHVNMQAFFSSVDEQVIRNCTSEWRVSLVVNKRGEHAIRLDVYRPFRSKLKTVLKIVYPEADKAVEEACAVEIAALVTKMPTVVYANPARYPYYDDHDYSGFGKNWGGGGLFGGFTSGK
jgi:hypothetical protein